MLVLFLFLTHNAQAFYYWDGNGTSPGGGNAPSGTWDTTTPNWSSSDDGTDPNTYGQDSVVAFSAGSDATGPYVVTVSGDVTVRDIHFDDGAAIITGGPLNISHGTNLISVLPDHVGTINCELKNPGGTTDAFHKYKMGTLILGGTNSYSGSTTIEGGTLQLGTNHCIPDSSTLILGNGGSDGFTDTPPTFHTGGFNEALGTLRLTGPNPSVLRTIDFGNGHSTLAFANSSGESWGSIPLTILNYTPGFDSLRFGTTSGGLTQAQLDAIHFNDFGNATGKIDNNGFVTPLFPSFKSVRIVGGQLEIIWNAINGRTYQLDYRDSFSSSWNFQGFFNATGSTVTTTDSLTQGTRFYRVELLP